MRGKQQGMQTLSGRGPGGLSAQSRRIAIMAILLFGLSGLISGFAVGAFIHPKAATTTGTTGPGGVSSPASQTTKTSNSPKVNPIEIGFPVFSQYAATETANGSTSYVLASYVVDTSKDAGHGNPLHAAGITCKLWIQHIPGDQTVHLPLDKLKSMDVQNPLTAEEISGGLNFTTPQIQQTNAHGQVTWKYSVSTNVQSGDYYLVVLMDWQGKHYNWSWVDITIKHAGD